jgi:hypothetical protein
MIILQNWRDEDVILPRCSNIDNDNIENMKSPYFDDISEVKPNVESKRLSKFKTSRTRTHIICGKEKFFAPTK